MDTHLHAQIQTHSDRETQRQALAPSDIAKLSHLRKTDAVNTDIADTISYIGID